MYEEITYEGLLSSMLTAALADQPGLDAREGSVLWYGQAPAAAEAQNLYIQLDAVLNETFADTASRPYLLRRAAERGLTPKPASCALIRGEFLPQTLEIPIERASISGRSTTRWRKSWIRARTACAVRRQEPWGTMFPAA